MNGEDEELVAVGDDTPSVIEQARQHGWPAGIFNFGKAEEPNVEFFNPGLVRRPDGLWLMVRRSEITDGMLFGKNGIWACQLKEDLTPVGGPALSWPESGPDEQFEDPRAVYWNGQTWIGCVNFTWFADGSWTGAHQVLGMFQDDDDWTSIARRDPPVGTNNASGGDTGGFHNKNWVWFFYDDKLHLIYTSDPWHVVEFGGNWDEQINHAVGAVKWKFGLVRGGTPPILVGDRFYTFFHSSLPWRGRFRRYYMGVVAFEAKPPFAPVLWSHVPLLTGSQNDPWQQRKPLVVFPCGALFENDQWLISFGINDLKCGWVKIPHEDILKLISPAPIAPAAMLAAAVTPKVEREAVPYVAPVSANEEVGPMAPPGSVGVKGPECAIGGASGPQQKRGRGRPKGSKTKHRRKKKH